MREDIKLNQHVGKMMREDIYQYIRLWNIALQRSANDHPSQAELGAGIICALCPRI